LNLPVKQTRILTWPVLTVFGFIAKPAEHIYLTPTVAKAAADTSRFGPKDMVDLQSMGSEEYPDYLLAKMNEHYSMPTWYCSRIENAGAIAGREFETYI